MADRRTYDNDQLHWAVSLFIAGRIFYEQERAAWAPLMKEIQSNKVPRDKRQMWIVNKIAIGTIIVFAYAIENLIKAFCPEIGKRHLRPEDLPRGDGLNDIEFIMFRKTIIPLLKEGFLRYHSPRQDMNLVDTHSAKEIFIKLFKFFVKRHDLALEEIKCFEVEFLKYKYPFVDELMDDTARGPELAI